MPIYTIKLNPGQTLPQPFAGSFLQYVEGEGPIEIRKNERDWNTYWVGTGTGKGEFSRIELRNPNAYAVTVSIWADAEEFIDRRRNQVEAKTEFIAVADSGGYTANAAGGELAATSFIDLPGTGSATLYRRKAVQIANLDPAVALLICNAADRVGLIVRAGESITLPASGFVRVKNATAAPIACSISEVWWTL